MVEQASTRARIVYRRTYARPLENGRFETTAQVIERVIKHQRWLYIRALLNNGSLEGDYRVGDTSRLAWEFAYPDKKVEKVDLELSFLKRLLENRVATLAGRTLWLGGTELARRRESAMFNCAFGEIRTVGDYVDHFWLLLQGCGTGCRPVPGVIHGYPQPVELECIPSTRSIDTPMARETTVRDERTEFDATNGNKLKVLKITVGDSATGWAKFLGYLLYHEKRYDKLIVDFSCIRAAGSYLKGYGWMSGGFAPLQRATKAIVKILNEASGRCLTITEMTDIYNWLGTVLSSRRSAEAVITFADDPQAEEFIKLKNSDWWVSNPQRAMSNNTLAFRSKPNRQQLSDFFYRMVANGGSDPGIANFQSASERAEWMAGWNPCFEILLGHRSFCNLVEINLAKLDGLSDHEICQIFRLMGRANYRQTVVNLRDGVLSDSWHELNTHLRLCGVGISGFFLSSHTKDAHKNPEKVAEFLRMIRDAATEGAKSMADELGLSWPKAVTTVKPSGTSGKIMDTTEGCHKPLGEYVFNNVMLPLTDPLVEVLKKANYRVIEHPFDGNSVIVTLPVKWEGVDFTETVRDNGEVIRVNKDTALEQLNIYKLLQENYSQHNTSITVYYGEDEIEGIIDWLYNNWDAYISISFLPRIDPRVTAQDLGFPYLPQEVVTEETYNNYVATLLPVNIDGEDLEQGVTLIGGDCSTGACPIR